MSLQIAMADEVQERPFRAWQSWAIAIAVTIGFFLAARLSLSLLDKSDGAAMFWPAAGVATGVLVACGQMARWPVVVGVVAATFVANLLGDRNLASTTVFAVANSTGPLIVLALLRRFCGDPFELDELRRVFELFAATILGSVISGLIGTLGFVFFHASNASFAHIWSHWGAAETIGTVAVAPLVIGVASFVRNPPPKREIAEGACALAIVATLCGLLAILPNKPWVLELAIASLAPLFVWIAARVRPAFTAIAIFMCAITIVWTTIYAVGLFGDAQLPVEERVLSAQATILATSFGALVLAALFSERRLHEHAIVEREELLEEALRAGGVITFDWNLQTGTIGFSPNAAEILGLGSQQSLSSPDWIRCIHPDDRWSATALLNETGLHHVSHSITFRFVRPDGRGEVWLEQVAITHFGVDAKPVRITGLATDITERRRFEREISSARKSAELADRAKSGFLSAASHDLRQPLQTLRFLQETLELHHRDGELRNVVDGIGRSLDTMSGILSSLLDVNRLEAGNLRPAKSDFAIDEIFRSLKADFSDAIAEKGLRWRVVHSGLVVRSDKRMLETMIRNLLSNGLRYTDRGRILLGCRRAGDTVRIEVWDSGIGISDHQLPHIFQEYYQGSPDSGRGGFGLGLAIVRRIGEMLGHRIGVRSTPNVGTVISIEVPRGDVAANETPYAQAPRQQDDKFRGTILVVEDEASVRTSISRLFKAKGMEAIVVATADDALARVRSREVRPDLLLCDYNLYGSTNGLATVKDLRTALGRNVPAIVMTGDVRSEIVDRIAAQGMSVLIKPFVAEELLSRIAQLSRQPVSGTTLS